MYTADTDSFPICFLQSLSFVDTASSGVLD